MKKIILLYQEATPSIDRVTQRLRCHFGPQRVVTSREQLPSLRDDDVVVVLLSESAAAGGGLPLDDFARLGASGIGSVFAREGIVVPVLFDGAAMPPHELLPESIRKLAFRHALPIRGGAELDRDLGRLMQDLEVHLNRYPGKIHPWDYWLLPIGLTGSVLFGMYSFTWLLDLWNWNYGYQTVQRYQQARFWLTTFWSGLLGLFLLITLLALHIRRYRLCAQQRAEHFHTGTASLPRHDSLIVSAALILAWTSVGWGWWCGAVAIVLGVAAIVLQALGFFRPPAWRRVIAAVGIAVLASAWSLWRISLMGQFETAIGEYEQGIAAVEADELEPARRHFEKAIEIYPRYGHPYQGLGLVYAKTDNPEAAYRELSHALARYPTDAQGLLDPDRKTVAAAYRNRAKVAEKLGRTEQAEKDNEMADKLTPFLNIFGGFFRWW